MTAPEDEPVAGTEAGTNGKDGIIAAIKQKAHELLEKTRAKFKPADHAKVETYLTEKDESRGNAGEKKKFSNTKREELKALSILVRAEASGAGLVTQIQDATAELVAAAPGLDTSDNQFMQRLVNASQTLDETNALPFARYILQLSERGLVQTLSATDVVFKLDLLKRVFLDEAELSSASLRPFATIYATALREYTSFFRNRKDFDALRKLHEEILERRGSFPAEEVALMDEAMKEMRTKLREGSLHRPGDDEAHDLDSTYKELESVIDESSVSDQKKREIKYQFLELDIDHITKELRTAGEVDTSRVSASIEEKWQELQRKYVNDLKNAAPDLVQLGTRYFSQFKKLLVAKMDWVEHWTMQGGEMTNDPWSRMYQHNLKNVFKKDYDQSLVAFAMFESEDSDIKDIYMRYKTKSYLEGLKASNKEEYDHQHHAIMEGKALKIDYREMEEVILKDVKRIWLKQIRLETEEKPPVQALQQMTSRLSDFFTTKGRLNEKKFRFMGQGDRSSVEVDVMTPRSSEIPMNPMFMSGGFARAGERGIRMDHQNLADLMMVFFDRTKELSATVRESKGIIGSVAKGDTEALQKAANYLNNYVFGALASDAPLITVAMQAYVESFRKLIALGRGQLRPGMFSAGEVGETSVQNAYIYNALKGISPDEEDDSIVVFSTIGKALAWGIGDIAPQLARALPPKEILIREIQKHSAELATRVRAVKEQYATASPEEREKRVIDKIWGYLNNVAPQLGLNAFDEFARALLFKTSPLFAYLLWVDEMNEFHINDLMFGGGFNAMEDKQPKGLAKFLKSTGRAFGKSDTMTDPGEILYLADREREALYMGMDDDVLEQRLQGKVPMSIRLPNMVGNLGIGERGAWRDNAFNLEALVSKYIASERVNHKMENFKLNELIDMALQIGPRTAIVLIDRLDLNRKPAPDAYFSQFNKNPEEFKKLKNYVYAIAYEMFPSLFALRTDIRRFTHKKDKVFIDEWQKKIEAQIAAELQIPPAQQRLMKLLPTDPKMLEIYYNSLDAEMQRYGMIDAQASFVQGILTDGLLALEKFVMYKRNMSGLQSDKRLTLREVLADLTAKGVQSAFYKEGAGRYFYPVIKQYDLKASLDEVIKLAAENIYDNFYGKSAAKIDFSQINTDTKPDRGLFNTLTYHNVGADTRGGREKRTDFFGLMQGIEKRFTGPMFDFYYENIYNSDPDIFDPQRTGDRASGKGLTVRAFSDFGSYVKGLESYMAAMKVIPEGIKSDSKEDLSKAEDNYLSKAMESAQSFESYTNNEKRYEIGSYFVILWLTMGKAPSQWGGDIRFLQELRKRMQGGQSLAELLNPKQMGALSLQSAMRYDYIGIQNFIYKAQKKGLLPLITSGKEIKPVHKVKETFAKKWFSKIDDELSKINDKMENMAEGEQVGFWDRFKKTMMEKTQNFGNAHFVWKFDRVDKAKFTARRLYDMMGINWQKNLVQFGMYFSIFLGVMTVIALQQGAKELEGGK